MPHMLIIFISTISCIMTSYLAISTIIYGDKSFKNKDKDSIIANDRLIVESNIINNKNKKGWKYGFKKY